jgi:hypothetical protein
MMEVCHRAESQAVRADRGFLSAATTSRSKAMAPVSLDEDRQPAFVRTNYGQNTKNK